MHLCLSLRAFSSQQTQFIVKCALANDSLKFNDFNYRLQCIQYKVRRLLLTTLAIWCNEKLQAIHFFPIEQPVSGEKSSGKFRLTDSMAPCYWESFFVWFEGGEKIIQCSVMCLIRKQHNWQFTITIYFSYFFVGFAFVSLCNAMKNFSVPQERQRDEKENFCDETIKGIFYNDSFERLTMAWMSGGITQSIHCQW